MRRSSSALTSLYCYNNQLTSLDVSKNTALDDLDCGYNQLTSLDMSKNRALTELYCNYNQLTSLDVSKNTALTSLDCSSNQLTSLDVSKNTALTSLWCYNNQLTSLDVSKNTVLTKLRCTNNNINGSAMDALVNSLNNIDKSKRFLVIDLDGVEGNVCTKSQVAVAKSKGWTPFYRNGDAWLDYEGSADTPSGIQMMSQEEWAKDNWS